MNVTTTITIDAPPHQVRQVLLDFPTLSTWHSGYIKSLLPAQSGKTGLDLAPGDKVRVGMGMTVTEVIQENSDKEFRWSGSVRFVFTATHSFIFGTHPSGDPNRSEFTQSEVFTGPLSSVVAPNQDKTRANFEKFNHDLKAEAELRWKSSN